MTRKKDQKKQNPLPNISFKSGDLVAILCALPLVSYLESDSPVQETLTLAALSSANNKLMDMLNGGSVSLSFGETCVIADAVETAVEVVSGRWPELAAELDSDWKHELSGHFFSLNRLHQQYVKLFEHLPPEQ